MIWLRMLRVWDRILIPEAFSERVFVFGGMRVRSSDFRLYRSFLSLNQSNMASFCLTEKTNMLTISAARCQPKYKSTSPFLPLNISTTRIAMLTWVADSERDHQICPEYTYNNAYYWIFDGAVDKSKTLASKYLATFTLEYLHNHSRYANVGCRFGKSTSNIPTYIRSIMIYFAQFLMVQWQNQRNSPQTTSPHLPLNISTTRVATPTWIVYSGRPHQRYLYSIYNDILYSISDGETETSKKLD